MFQEFVDLIKQGRKAKLLPDTDPSEEDYLIASAFFLVEAIYADDIVDEREVETLSGVLAADSDLDSQGIMEIIDVASFLSTEGKFGDQVREFIKKHFSEKQKSKLLAQLVAILHADEVFKSIEERFLEKVVEELEIDPATLDSLCK